MYFLLRYLYVALSTYLTQYTKYMRLSKAEAHICQADQRLGVVIKRNGHIALPEISGDYFAELAQSIISQQLSVKAAATIFARFKNVTDLQPQKALAITEAQQKEIGLSGQKARYIRDLAEHFVNDPAVFDHLDTLSDEGVIAELTKVKGTGTWTAQMFLMFTLNRPDVFAPDDLGLQNAIAKVYDLPARPTRAEALQRAEFWAPYRTTACLHLWHLLDNKPSGS